MADELVRQADEQDRTSRTAASITCTVPKSSRIGASTPTSRDLIDHLLGLLDLLEAGDLLLELMDADPATWLSATRGVPWLPVLTGGTRIVVDLERYGPHDARTWQTMFNNGMDTALSLSGFPVLAVGFYVGTEGTNLVLRATGYDKKLGKRAYELMEADYDLDDSEDVQRLSADARNPVILSKYVAKSVADRTLSVVTAPGRWVSAGWRRWGW